MDGTQKMDQVSQYKGETSTPLSKGVATADGQSNSECTKEELTGKGDVDWKLEHTPQKAMRKTLENARGDNSEPTQCAR